MMGIKVLSQAYSMVVCKIDRTNEMNKKKSRIKAQTVDMLICRSSGGILCSAWQLTAEACAFGLVCVSVKKIANDWC